MRLDIHEKTSARLKVVTALQNKLQKDKKHIQGMKYRKLGMNLIAVDEFQKQRMMNRAVTDCNGACSKIYEQLNRERLQAGLPALENPYQKG